MAISPEALSELTTKGVTTFDLEPSVGHPSAQRLAREAKNPIVRRLLSRPFGDEDWQNVRRTTFFPDPQTKAQAFLRPSLWVPSSVMAYLGIETDLRQLETQTGLPLTTTANRIGINYMNGSVDRPAVIGEHRDPVCLKGVVTIISVEGQGHGTHLGKVESVTMVACHDLCEVLGIEQVEHGVVSEESRISYTFSRLDRSA